MPLYQASRLNEADMGAAMYVKNKRGKKLYRTFAFVDS